MSQPRILVFAYSSVGHACLKTLLDNNENIVAVYTHEDHPTETLWFPSVQKCAIERGIPVFTDEDLSSPDEQRRLMELKPDLILSFYYRNLIPPSVLALAPLGAFNMHGSLLPKYRGRAPVNWVLLNGETETGATLHEMVEKADAGDIVDQLRVPIGPDDTAFFVQDNVTKAAVVILNRQLKNLKNGCAPRIKQDHSIATKFGRRRPEDGLFDWSWPAQRIHNMIRALTHPYPGAFANFHNRKYFFWASQMLGEKIPLEDERLIVRCGDGALLEIVRLQEEGEQEISGHEFLKRNTTVQKELV